MSERKMASSSIKVVGRIPEEWTEGPGSSYAVWLNKHNISLAYDGEGN